jgi:hypothetical protein
MAVLARMALGFAVLRGSMLTALTVPWLLQKIRRADATESERSLVLMVGSRTILLGFAILALWLTNRREALAWALLGDGVLQLFDALLALAQRKRPLRTLAVLPTILCLLDAWAGVTLGRP